MCSTQALLLVTLVGNGTQFHIFISFSYYSASILKLAGFPVELAIWLVCVPNVVNCLCTFIGIWLVEKAGRRLLTIVSMIGKKLLGALTMI